MMYNKEASGERKLLLPCLGRVEWTLSKVKPLDRPLGYANALRQNRASAVRYSHSQSPNKKPKLILPPFDNGDALLISHRNFG